MSVTLTNAPHRRYQSTDSCQPPSRRSEHLVSTDKELGNINLLDIIGERGWHQVLVGGLCLISNVVASWNVLGYTFFSYPMDYWCARPDGDAFTNLTVAEWKNMSVVSTINNDLKGCFMHQVVYEDDEVFRKNGTIVKCNSWEFHDNLFFETIISKWGLVCQNASKVPMSQTVYMIGFMLSVLVSGQLGDRLGRRPVLLLGIVIYLVAGLITSLSNSFVFFVIFRFFVALSIHGTMMTSFVVLMECLGPSYRPLYYLSLSIGWAIGYTTIPGLAYITRDWAYLQLSFVCFGLTLLPFWWYCLESPRWLLTQGMYEAAESVMITIAKRNRIWRENTHFSIQQLILASDKVTGHRDPNKASLIDLLRTPNMRKKSFVMFYLWFTASFVYYGIVLNLEDFVGNILVNTAIFGALEFVSAIFGFVCFSYVMRKPTSVALFAIVAACCFAFTGIPQGMVKLRTALAAIGKLFIEMGFDLAYIYSAEIFPTVVRNVGVGCSSTVARIGSSIAPLMKEMIRKTGNAAPMAIFGAVTTLAGLLVLLLPETRAQELPDTLEQGEQFGKKSKNKGDNKTDGTGEEEVTERESDPTPAEPH